jgi:hypothetical protein
LSRVLLRKNICACALAQVNLAWRLGGLAPQTLERLEKQEELIQV